VLKKYNMLFLNYLNFQRLGFGGKPLWPYFIGNVVFFINSRGCMSAKPQNHTWAIFYFEVPVKRNHHSKGMSRLRTFHVLRST
jgi:hypothetical protein